MNKLNLLDRFLNYVSYHTTSDEESEAVPSTARQKLLGARLVEELREMGVMNAEMDAFGRVYAYLEPHAESETEPIGLIAHMDTAPAASGENVKPRVIEYTGGDIVLSETEKTTVREFPFLEDYKGQRLVVTDGTTLLGADDKAGLAEIVTAVEYLISHPDIKRRGVAVCFTPDEEVGRGAEHFDFERFAAKRAYTVDGGTLGEIEYENFNAAAVTVRVKGVNIHPGDAKNKMRNAVLLATEFVSMLPAAETPAHTEGYEGFYHVCSIHGDENEAEVKLIIRDHDLVSFTGRKQRVERMIAYLSTVYGDGVFTAQIKDSYYNMKKKILPHFDLITDAEKAFRAAGVEPKTVPIRGGTDGAVLSYKGLPCPNLSTGGENFHGVHEFVSVDAMETMVRVLVEICRG